MRTILARCRSAHAAQQAQATNAARAAQVCATAAAPTTATTHAAQTQAQTHGARKSPLQKAASALLSLVLVAGLLPVAPAVAAADDAADSAGTTPTSETVTVTFDGLYSNQFITYLKIYAYDDGTKGEANLMEGVEPTPGTSSTSRSYTVDLPVGSYWMDAYDAKDSKIGGINFEVTTDTQTITPYTAYGLCSSNSAWVYQENYDLTVNIANQKGTPRKVEIGATNKMMPGRVGTIAPSIIYLSGDSVAVTATPIGDRADTWVGETWIPDRTTQNWKKNFNFTEVSQNTYSFIVKAPVGSTITGGRFNGLYNYEYNKFQQETTTDENGVTSTFTIKESDTTAGKPFFRVQHPNGVTYWDFSEWKGHHQLGEFDFAAAHEGNVYTVTADDLHIGDSSFTKSTLYRYEKIINDRADIYLNINAQGYKSMATGDTFTLNTFRIWQAIDSFANGKIAVPDTHYQVIDEFGNPSDVVSITPDSLNSCTATMKANKPGTAIVLVTYDAMNSPQSSSDLPEGADHFFSAIWPECTGVFVVSVDADGTGIQTNMQMDRLDSDKSSKTIDAEADTLFYLGDEGATYSFTPEEGCTVTLNRPVVDNAMTFKGFTSDGVSVAADGTVTITGLTTGRNIVKLEKNGAATYQVITARQATFELQDAEGNALPENAKVKPGQTVTLQFHNLISPLEKMATVYNNNFCLYYEGADGTFFRTWPEGSVFGGMYSFNGNPELQKVQITIPKDWAGTTYALKGAITLGGFSGGTGHRSMSYGITRAPVFDADASSGIYSLLPAVTLNVEQPVGNVSVDVTEGSGATGADVPASTVRVGDTVTVNVSVAAGAGAEGVAVAAMSGTLDYDPAVFELVSVTKGTGLSADASFLPEGGAAEATFSFYGNEAGGTAASGAGTDAAASGDTANSAADDGSIVVATATFKAIAASDATTIGMKDAVGATAGESADREVAVSEPASLTVLAAGATLGDVNGNGRVNIVDAQATYDMACGKYGTDYSALPMPASWTRATQLWAANVNADDAIDAADAFAIQRFMHYGAWS